ncbi:MAG: late competence development ComFB family protein [Chitinophagales bacterium]
MEVKNVMESLVLNTLEEVMRAAETTCFCEKCKADIAAYALNNLKPKYATTEKGEIISRTMNLGFQTRMDVIAAITEAIKVVGKNPHHD